MYGNITNRASSGYVSPFVLIYYLPACNFLLLSGSSDSAGTTDLYRPPLLPDPILFYVRDCARQLQVQYIRLAG